MNSKLTLEPAASQSKPPPSVLPRQGWRSYHPIHVQALLRCLRGPQPQERGHKLLARAKRSPTGAPSSTIPADRPHFRPLYDIQSVAHVSGHSFRPSLDLPCLKKLPKSRRYCLLALPKVTEPPRSDPPHRALPFWAVTVTYHHHHRCWRSPPSRQLYYCAYGSHRSRIRVCIWLLSTAPYCLVNPVHDLPQPWRTARRLPPKRTSFQSNPQARHQVQKPEPTRFKDFF